MKMKKKKQNRGKQISDSRFPLWRRFHMALPIQFTLRCVLRTPIGKVKKKQWRDIEEGREPG